MSVSGVVKQVGKYTLYTGVASISMMVIVGTVAIDIVCLAAAIKNAQQGHSVGFVCTLWLWNCFSLQSHNALILMLISPLFTATAVGLSIALGVPMVGLCLFLGWAVAASILAIGFSLYQLGDCLEQQAVKSSPVIVAECESKEQKYEKYGFFSPVSHAKIADAEPISLDFAQAL